jgi:S-DNA-T family DNA segregation ATPase FtsK/SpoIIIE
LKKNNKRTTQTDIKNPRSRIASESLFILFLTLGVVFLTSLVTHSPDEDPFTGGAQLIKPVLNSAGIFGAYLSDISIGVLGYVSYIVPIALIWLGYNFHRDASKEQSSQVTFLIRLIAFLVMLFFSAALVHQFAPEIKIIEGLKATFLAGGMIGKSMHEGVFNEVFGSSSTIIYIGIIFISFSISSSSSWGSISASLFKKTFSREEGAEKASKFQLRPEIISSPPISPDKPERSEKIEKPKKAEKVEKPKKAEKVEKPKKEKVVIYTNQEYLVDSQAFHFWMM